MDLVVAFAFAIAVNTFVVSYLSKRYDAELGRVVVWTYVGSLTIRYVVAIILWLYHRDVDFAIMFWGDSETYDRMGFAVAEAWSNGGNTTLWKSTIEGTVNRGFIYFVACLYYVFGRNTLLIQLVNGIIGTLTPVVILEIGLLLYNRRVATKAMLFTAFFPQMVFWSAAMYKDAAVMLCIALNMLCILKLRDRFSPGSLAGYAVTASALIFLRFYIFVVVVAGLLVYRFDAPLFFANSGHLRDEITDLMETADHPVREVLIDAEAISDIDATGAQILNELLDSLNEAGIQLGMARVKSEVREELVAAGIEERVGEDHFYLEVDDGVDDFLARHPEAGDGDRSATGHA